MNKLAPLRLCFTLALMVLISSCKDNLNQPNLPGFRCAFGNQEYVADSAVYYYKGANQSQGTNIYAYTGGKIKFVFYIDPLDTLGSVSLDSTRNIAWYNPTSNPTIDPVQCFRSTSGSLTFTQYYNDSLKVINGYFSFNSTIPGSSGNSLNFTYGYFNGIHRRY